MAKNPFRRTKLSLEMLEDRQTPASLVNLAAIGPVIMSAPPICGAPQSIEVQPFSFGPAAGNNLNSVKIVNLQPLNAQNSAAADMGSAGGSSVTGGIVKVSIDAARTNPAPSQPAGVGQNVVTTPQLEIPVTPTNSANGGIGGAGGTTSDFNIPATPPNSSNGKPRGISYDNGLCPLGDGASTASCTYNPPASVENTDCNDGIVMMPPQGTPAQSAASGFVIDDGQPGITHTVSDETTGTRPADKSDTTLTVPNSDSNPTGDANTTGSTTTTGGANVSDQAPPQLPLIGSGLLKGTVTFGKPQVTQNPDKSSTVVWHGATSNTDGHNYCVDVTQITYADGSVKTTEVIEECQDGDRIAINTIVVDAKKGADGSSSISTFVNGVERTNVKTDANGNTVTTEYDANHNVVKTSTAAAVNNDNRNSNSTPRFIPHDAAESILKGFLDLGAAKGRGQPGFGPDANLADPPKPSSKTEGPKLSVEPLPNLKLDGISFHGDSGDGTTSNQLNINAVANPLASALIAYAPSDSGFQLAREPEVVQDGTSGLPALIMISDNGSFTAPPFGGENEWTMPHGAWIAPAHVHTDLAAPLALLALYSLASNAKRNQFGGVAFDGPDGADDKLPLGGTLINPLFSNVGDESSGPANGEKGPIGNTPIDDLLVGPGTGGGPRVVLPSGEVIQLTPEGEKQDDLLVGPGLGVTIPMANPGADPWSGGIPLYSRDVPPSNRMLWPLPVNKLGNESFGPACGSTGPMGQNPADLPPVGGLRDDGYGGCHAGGFQICDGMDANTESNGDIHPTPNGPFLGGGNGLGGDLPGPVGPLGSGCGHDEDDHDGNDKDDGCGHNGHCTQDELPADNNGNAPGPQGPVGPGGVVPGPAGPRANVPAVNVNGANDNNAPADGGTRRTDIKPGTTITRDELEGKTPAAIPDPNEPPQPPPGWNFPNPGNIAEPDESDYETLRMRRRLAAEAMGWTGPVTMSTAGVTPDRTNGTPTISRDLRNILDDYQNLLVQYSEAKTANAHTGFIEGRIRERIRLIQLYTSPGGAAAVNAYLAQEARSCLYQMLKLTLDFGGPIASMAAIQSILASLPDQPVGGSGGTEGADETLENETDVDGADEGPIDESGEPGPEESPAPEEGDVSGDTEVYGPGDGPQPPNNNPQLLDEPIGNNEVPKVEGNPHQPPTEAQQPDYIRELPAEEEPPLFNPFRDPELPTGVQWGDQTPTNDTIILNNP
jgi:hypothetical protein